MERRIKRRGWGCLVALVALGAMTVIAAGCRGEDRPSDSESTSGTAEVIQPGVVKSLPAGATQVNVTLQEWSIQLAQPSAKAGLVYFLADNKGQRSHELVVIKSDRAPDQLPMTEGKVDEKNVKLIDEIKPFTANSKASLVYKLDRGKYVLICNIRETRGFEFDSHYPLGMRVAFTVE